MIWQGCRLTAGPCHFLCLLGRVEGSVSLFENGSYQVLQFHQMLQIFKLSVIRSSILMVLCKLISKNRE